MNNSILPSKKCNKNIFNLAAEKLVRVASENFVHFKNYELALQQVNEVIDMEPQHTKALMLKGDILLCTDKDHAALEQYELAIQSDAHCAQAYGSKAGVLDMLGRQKEALENCRKAFQCITAKDKNLLASLYDQKLSILHRLKNFEEAKEVLRIAINNLPKEDGNYLASCYKTVIEKDFSENLKSQESNSKLCLQLVY